MDDGTCVLTRQPLAADECGGKSRVRASERIGRRTDWKSFPHGRILGRSLARPAVRSVRDRASDNRQCK